MITETIGSASRQRTDPSAWFAAISSTLTDDVTGNCYNDSEFLLSSSINMTGKTIGSFTITLACASGQSFYDSSNKLTNLLAYSTSNGVGIRVTNSYTNCITGNQTGVTLIGLQCAGDGTHNLPSECPIYFTGGNPTLKNCLVRAVNANILIAANTSTILNSLFYKTGSGGDGIACDNSSTFIGNTVARTTTNAAAGKGFKSTYGSSIVKNCAFFGFTVAPSGGYTGCSNNATDMASGLPGTSNQHSVTYSGTAPFKQASNSSTDFRAITSTSLVGNGVYDSTNSPNDIVGQTRANPPTIGAWEFIAGGASQSLSGVFISTNEITFSGNVTNNYPLTGSFAKPDSSIFNGSMGIGAIALSGINSKTDEKSNSGSLYQFFNLQGNLITPDEKINSNSIAVGSVTLSGSNSKTDEKINANSLSALPYTALWTSPANTNLGSVKPATAPSGTNTYTAVIASWGGAVFGGGYFIIAANGGHTNYAGNEVYALRVSDFTPLLLRNPTSNTIIAASDSLESTGLYATDATGVTADPQAPRSRHGYSMEQWCTYKSKVALMGAVGIYPSGQTNSSVIRYYDPVANTWETGPTILTPFNGPYSATCEDASGNLWFIGAGTGGRLNRIVPSTGVVTEFGNAFMFSLTSYYRTGIHDPVNNRFWIFGGDGGGTNMQVGYWDLTNTAGNIDFTPVTPTGDIALLGAIAPGVAWFPSDNKIVVWSGGTAVTVFDPTTFKATSVTLNSGNATTPSASTANGTYGRFRAISADTFLCVNSMDENFYKLTLRGADKVVTGTLSTTDEKLNAATLNSSIGLNGNAIKTDEVINLNSTIGSIILGGQFIPTPESIKVNTITTSIGITGSNIQTIENIFTNVITPNAIPLAGVFIKTDEKNYSSLLSLGGQTLSGVYSSTDEKTNIGAIALGAIGLTGSNISTDETINLGSVSTPINLSGISIKSDEKTFLSALGFFTILAGANIATDEQIKNAVMSYGTVSLGGSNIQTGEYFYVSAIIGGVNTTTTVYLYCPITTNINLSTVIAP